MPAVEHTSEQTTSAWYGHDSSAEQTAGDLLDALVCVAPGMGGGKSGGSWTGSRAPGILKAVVCRTASHNSVLCR